MSFVQRNIQNWRDGKRIEDYCIGHGYSRPDIFALREIHRLHLEQEDGSLDGTVQEALETMARSTESQKQIAKAIFLKINPIKDAMDALFRFVDDPNYANKILSAYQTDVKPNLNL